MDVLKNNEEISEELVSKSVLSTNCIEGKGNYFLNLVSWSFIKTVNSLHSTLRQTSE